MKFFLFIKKSLLFIIRYSIREPVFTMKYMFAYFKSDYKANVRIMDSLDLLNGLYTGKTLIRLGDGEIALIKMIDVHFQKASRQLAVSIKKSIANYTIDSPYILAVPTRYINKSNNELRKIGLLNCWLPFKIAFNSFFPKNVEYADAHAFYVSGFFEQNLTDYIKNKKVIVVTKKDSISKLQKNIKLSRADILYVETPDNNSFEVYEKIKELIDSLILDVDPGKIVILAAAGPASKVLAYNYSAKGVQVLDIGHGIEHLYTGKALDHILV